MRATRPDLITPQAAKSVWVAWTNSDTTEGRGYLIPLVVCASEVTAERLGADHSTDRRGPTHADENARKAARKVEAIRRAKAAGLSEADIEALRH